MTVLQIWLLKIGATLAVVAAIAGTTWFMADAHYTKQYTALKAQYEQAQKDQAAEDAATLSRYAAAAQEVNDDYAKQVAGLSADIADLRMRVDGSQTALGICTNDQMRPGVPEPDGSGAATSPGIATSATEPPEPIIAIPAGQLRDDLQIGIKAIDSELLLRKLLRDGGQE